MLLRILHIFGTFWLMVYPVDTLDVFESWFRFFILRMRLVIREAFRGPSSPDGLATRCLGGEGPVRRALGASWMSAARDRSFRFCFDKASKKLIPDINCNSIIPCLWIQTIKKYCVVSTNY
uniref:Secreted protein n=1 Tax=Molossus molossus TaxID=27622 RepID=A0A7J8DBR7_MOLMO|nr:hypothetical protein HJG59_009317 [Molossus molossus]